MLGVYCAGQPLVEGLEKYARTCGEDDDRQRMLMEVLAFGFVVLPVNAGI